jgi:hypothetical protein
LTPLPAIECCSFRAPHAEFDAEPGIAIREPGTVGLEAEYIRKFVWLRLNPKMNGKSVPKWPLPRIAERCMVECQFGGGMNSFSLVCHHWGRSMGLFFCLVCLLMLPGCWVYSINSLYENKLFAPRDPDIVFDSGLIGTWKVSNEDCLTTLSIVSTEEPHYQLKVKGEGKECNDEGKELQFEARLVKLDSRAFLDVSARAEDICTSCLDAHQIYLTTLGKNTLDLIPVDSEWLKNAIEGKRISMATVAGNTDILTGSSKELKEFCRKYADDKAVFKPDPSLSFKRG